MGWVPALGPVRSTSWVGRPETQKSRGMYMAMYSSSQCVPYRTLISGFLVLLLIFAIPVAHEPSLSLPPPQDAHPCRRLLVFA